MVSGFFRRVDNLGDSAFSTGDWRQLINHRRAWIYVVVVLLLTIGLTAGHGIEWRGNSQSHTLMEVAATLLAAVTAARAPARFASSSARLCLFVGV